MRSLPKLLRPGLPRKNWRRHGTGRCGITRPTMQVPGLSRGALLMRWKFSNDSTAVASSAKAARSCNSLFPFRAFLSTRHDAQDTARRSIREQPQRAVRALPHVADAVGKPAQQPFLPAERLAVEFQPQQHLALQAADKQVAAPGREQIAMPEGAIDGVQCRSGCSMPSLWVLAWILAPL